ncbi:unnamed protein product, partial [Amoebophrya sp. A25]
AESVSTQIAQRPRELLQHILGPDREQTFREAEGDDGSTLELLRDALAFSYPDLGLAGAILPNTGNAGAGTLRQTPDLGGGTTGIEEPAPAGNNGGQERVAPAGGQRTEPNGATPRNERLQGLRSMLDAFLYPVRFLLRQDQDSTVTVTSNSGEGTGGGLDAAASPDNSRQRRVPRPSARAAANIARTSGRFGVR